MEAQLHATAEQIITFGKLNNGQNNLAWVTPPSIGRHYTNLKALFMASIVMYIPKSTLFVVSRIHAVAGEGIQRSLKVSLFSW